VDEYVRHRGSRRLAAEAKVSHGLLVETLERDARERGPEHEAEAHEIARLLGECRFGYRAAISAWPENRDARAGLDAALLSVIDYSLASGDTGTAETLLREVSDKPPDVVGRVDGAVKARSEHDERLHRLETDLDPAIGSRTRSFLGGLFGLLFTCSPWERGPTCITWGESRASSPRRLPRSSSCSAGRRCSGLATRSPRPS
jgi:serine/threonine-protein kinase